LLRFSKVDLNQECYSGYSFQHNQMRYAQSDSQGLWNKAPIAALAVYLLWACILGFRSPGMNYDEAVFLNGAVQVLQSGQEPSFAHDPWSWGTAFGRRWPIMVLPYAGALREYLALIPFGIFGPNYYTARGLMALLGAFGIWGVSILVRSQFGIEAAALVSWILAVHPAYLALTIYDQGGVAEWMVPQAVFAIALAHYLKTRTSLAAFWLGAAMGFGAWSRANFVWLLGSALLAGMIVLRKRMLIRGRDLAILVIGGILGGAPLLWYEIQSHGATLAFRSTNSQSLLSLAGHRFNLLSQTFLYDSEHRAIWTEFPMPLWQKVFFSSLVVVALLVCLTGPEIRKPARMAALIFLALLACMLSSRLNISDHHLIALVPIAALLVVVTGQECCRRWPASRRLAAAIAGIYLVSALYWNVTAARQTRLTGGIGIWSNAIDSVRSYLQQNYPGRRIKVLDWGFQNSLFVLSNAKLATTELFWGATVEGSGLGKLWKDEIAPGDVYLLHAPSLAQFPEAAQGLSRALTASALAVRRAQFTQNSGAGYAEVIEIVASSR
jgi:hypothetical protein